ncbi:discoidin domain-containing protein [Microbacterium sp. 179-I 3D2 NHS]|uniref:galactose-binding domain-containing protein n=1 Tax=Microbacterium sp. 179-I 3D2 NHS TaxID=3235178 RepID=UPI0039A03617
MTRNRTRATLAVTTTMALAVVSGTLVAAPANAATTTITNGTVTATIDDQFPRALSYQLVSSGAVLQGDPVATAPVLQINGTTVTFALESFSKTADTASYVLDVVAPDVDIAVSLKVEGSTLVEKITSVTGAGEPSVETIDLLAANLRITAADTSPSGAYYWSTNHYGMSETDAENINTLSALNNNDVKSPWAFVSTANAVGSVYNNLETTPMRVVVSGSDSSKAMAIYDRPFFYRVGSLKPARGFESRTHIGGDTNASGSVDWQDGALWVRDQLPAVPTALKSFMANGGQWTQTNYAHPQHPGVDGAERSSQLLTPYDTLAAQQRQIFYQTDGASKQNYAGAGWQKYGHDDNWPDWANNPRNLGLGALEPARDEMARYNGQLSFHVNADDIYESSQTWASVGQQIVAKNANGSYTQSYHYLGRNGHRISHLKDFVSGNAQARTNAFVSAYGAPTVVYQDVMLNEPSLDVGYTVDHDWYGLKLHTDQWLSHGVHLTTEYYAPERRRNGGFLFKRYGNDSLIDQFINAGATYMQNNYYNDEAKGNEQFDWLFGTFTSSRSRNGNFNAAQNWNADEIVRETFLLTMLNSYLRQESARAYENLSDRHRVTWSGGITAELFKSDNRLKVTDDGVTVAEGTDRFLPQPDGAQKIYVYSGSGVTREWTLPASWSGVSSVRVFELTESGRSYLRTIPVNAGKVIVATAADVPYLLLPASGAEPALGPGNRAIGGTATASSTDGAFAAGNATDGDGATRWAATTGGTAQWLQTVLPRFQTVNRAVISESGSAVTGFAIQRWDGSTWQTVKTGTTIGSNKEVTFPTLSVDRLRIAFTGTTAAPSISEFRLFGDANLAANATFSAASNSVQASGYALDKWEVQQSSDGVKHKRDIQASRAQDGSDASHWRASAASGQWVEADFRRPVSIDRFVVKEVGSAVSGFTVQRWDGSAWQNVATGTTIAAVREIDVAEFTATRVRLNLTAASAAPAIAEFAAYDRGGAQLGGTAVNLAQGKTATQSTTHETGVASRAVDGNTDGAYLSQSTTHTAIGGSDPWWKVDLGASIAVGDIEIWNRTDCCANRLDGLTVEVLDASSNVVWTKTQAAAPSPSSIFSPSGVQGRYVRVRLTGTDKILSLAEVKVFAAANAALSGVASQSSMYSQSGTPVAARAVDNNTNGVWASGSIASTEFETNPWWKVAFAETKTVGSVVVWNRTDCCGDRLAGFTVEVLNGSGGVVWSTTVPAAPTPSAVIQPPVGTQGQQVRVSLIGTNKTLALAEVQVFAR